MEAIAWRNAQGSEPIDNRTAESLDRFYVAKAADAQRALVTGSGPWQVPARDLAGTYARSLGRVERRSDDYVPRFWRQPPHAYALTSARAPASALARHRVRANVTP